MTTNIHERHLPGVDAGSLIDSLSSKGDRLWPNDRWPTMRFDRPLGVGARGGHGPIRYDVVAYTPGEHVRFRFTGPPGLNGYHEWGRSGDVLRHTVQARMSGRMIVLWPLVFRWLHDALIEDALDRAEGVKRSRWSAWVRGLRWAMGRGRRRRAGGARVTPARSS